MKAHSNAQHNANKKRPGHIEQLQSEIELRKYEDYQQTVSNDGSELEDWAEAESEVLEPEHETENS